MAPKYFGGVIFLYEVQNPSQYGVANILNERVINIIEKPKNPRSSLVVTGLYIYNKKGLLTLYKEMIGKMKIYIQMD